MTRSENQTDKSTDKLPAHATSRRAVLFGIGGAATLGVGFGTYQTMQGAWRSGAIINAWVGIAPDGFVDVVVPGLELGQGASLVLPMVVAEEMEADLGRVRAIAAPRDAATYGNPMFDGRMVTADSKTTAGYFDILRLAGAQARIALVAAAASWKGWREGDCLARDHAVLHLPSGARVAFGDVAGRASLPSHIRAVTKAEFKARSRYTLIGTRPVAPRAREIATGRLTYGIDTRTDDAAVALLVRGARIGSVPDTIVDDACRKVSGVIDVVTLPDAVAVVASSLSAAIAGRSALNATFRGGVDYDSAADLKRLEAAARQGATAKIIRESGRASEAARTYQATFASAHVSHMALEPLSAEARPAALGLGVSVSSSTQSVELDMRYAARNYKTLPLAVSTVAMPTGGAYGRRVLNDVVGEAAALCKLLKRPVKVVRLAADELKRGQVRPASGQFVEAGVDDRGTLVSWRHTVASDSVLARHLPETLARRDGIDNTSTDGLLHSYRAPHVRISWQHEPAPPMPGFLRGVSAGYAVFAIETMIDRIARGAGRDPLQWRLDHIDAQPERDVLTAVGEMAGWSTSRRAGHALGLAYMTFRGSHVATIAEVTAKGRVASLFIAANVGLAIHPGNVIAQVEGGALMGVSMALAEEIVFKDGQAQIDAVSDYPMTAADDMPQVTVRLVGHETATHPRGVGEIGVPTVAPAIANALSVHTGKTYTRLPLAIR